MANMRQQSKGREKERDILGNTPPQFWLLSRRNFGYFPAVWLISRLAVHFPTCFWLIPPPPPLVDFLPHFVVDDTPRG